MRLPPYIEDIELRYVKREALVTDGIARAEQVLQSRKLVCRWQMNNVRSSQWTEWEDVPVVDETVKSS